MSWLKCLHTETTRPKRPVTETAQIDSLFTDILWFWSMFKKPRDFLTRGSSFPFSALFPLMVACDWSVKSKINVYMEQRRGKAVPYPPVGGGPTIRRDPTIYIVLVS